MDDGNEHEGGRRHDGGVPLVDGGRLEVRFEGLPHAAGPATWGQRTIWAPISWYAPDDHYFNIALPVELRHPVEPAAFGAAVRALLERHESLRTLYRTTPDGGLEQLLGGTGTLDVGLVVAPAGEPVAAVLQRVAARDRAVRFELSATGPDRGGRLGGPPPLRVSAALVDGLVAGAVLTMAHIAADGTGALVVRDDLRRLLAQQRRRPGTLPPPVPGRQPREQAAYEAGPQAAARSAAAVALWTRQLAEIPGSLWPEAVGPEGPGAVGPEGPGAVGPGAVGPEAVGPEGPGAVGPEAVGPEGPGAVGPEAVGPEAVGPEGPEAVGPEGPGVVVTTADRTEPAVGAVERWWEGQLVCPRLDAAGRVAALRTGTSPSAVVLAAVGMELGARTGAGSVPLKVILGNRVNEAQRTAVGAFAQNGLVVLGTAGPFDELARQAWRAQLQTSRHGHYDPGALAEAVAAEEERRGTALDLNAFFNDHRPPDRSPGGEAAPAGPVAPGGLPAGRFSWRPRWVRQDSTFFFGLAHREGEPIATLLVDTRYFPAAEVEPFLRAVEERVTAAAG
ncbi:hypothetical protein [Kitasatospora sp. A2-31]|uniref:hypothetical protein n=1 Tax=Kitasatospora sp. A2-31 TaxID=2916414 RepID=UPI001EEB46CD|nr:hypothetical protein [Kitasatospora sp. A2-31]MCG6494013.1 hypothetical protein [Kitasatospora sp. A2-31]